jgi:hypothetical protein
MTMVL